VKQLVKKWLYAVAPQWTTALMSARARAHAHKMVRSWGCTDLNQKLIAQLGNAVLEGPFAGMVLSPMTHAEHLGPYLLGVYESELDRAWEAVLRGAYSQVIDVGAKFGYYAVGLARRYPGVPVVAFDTDWWARKAVREMAAANGVSNVEVRGFCSPAWLARNLREGAFLISDCEGYEAELFGAAAPALRSATLIVETHDCFVPGVSDRLRASFGGTHTVHVLGDSGGRRVSSRSLEFLPEEQRQLANQEVRPPQLWLLCLPREGPNAALRLAG
jgi:hypothetical protein